MSGTMSKNKVKLPDFIVCGFQKCATSALSRTLSQHSKLSIARTDDESAKFCKGKEINFFAKSGQGTFHRGIDWYKSHFIDDGNLWGECSPNYSMWNPWFAIEQFKVHLGDNTKFIFSGYTPVPGLLAVNIFSVIIVPFFIKHELTKDFLAYL